jgi:L-asparaginase
MVRVVASQQKRPRILVCALGGTIAMTRADEPGVVPTQSGQALVDAVPSLADIADVEAMSFRQIPGAHLTLDDVVELARLLTESAENYDGFVVTQGTDTIEETACALDLLWQRDVPVIVTGAMRNPTLPGTDGPGNLLAAVTVAAHPAARGAGCLVVLGDEVHAGRAVQKRHSTRPSAFTSPGGGPVGVVSEGDVHLWATPRRTTLDAIPDTPVPPVALLRLTLGDDGRLATAVAAQGYEGLVVEAFGGGHATPAVAEALGNLVSAMPVVLASRTGAGPVLHSTYGFPGSEMDLLGRGLISAGTWDGLKARILLSFCLAAGSDRETIANLFSTG